MRRLTKPRRKNPFRRVADWEVRAGSRADGNWDYGPNLVKDKSAASMMRMMSAARRDDPDLKFKIKRITPKDD